MKNLKRLLPFWIALSTWLILANPAHSQMPSQDYEGHFPALTFSKLHLCMSQMDWNGTKIGAHFPFLPVRENRKFFHCIGWFKVDTADQYHGYLLGQREEQKIYLYIVRKSTAETLLGTEVANYAYLSGAYESYTNCWIMDVDNDHTMDILVEKNLQDFELPTEQAPNISGGTSARFSLVNGKIEYMYWPEDLEVGPRCK